MAVLAQWMVALSQGLAFFHAGDELLRSKSLDRDSYDSGIALSFRRCWFTDLFGCRHMFPRRRSCCVSTAGTETPAIRVLLNSMRSSRYLLLRFLIWNRVWQHRGSGHSFNCLRPSADPDRLHYVSGDSAPSSRRCNRTLCSERRRLVQPAGLQRPGQQLWGGAAGGEQESGAVAREAPLPCPKGTCLLLHLFLG